MELRGSYLWLISVGAVAALSFCAGVLAAGEHRAQVAKVQQSFQDLRAGLTRECARLSLPSDPCRSPFSGEPIAGAPR